MERSFGVKRFSSLMSDAVTELNEEADRVRMETSESAKAESTAETLPGEESESGRQLSTLGETLVFKGQLNAAEDLLIQGKVEGSIMHSGSNLTIGAHGNVKADIEAQRVIVQGTMQGDIRASEAIVVEPSAKVKGNMYAPRIALKEGARFKGTIDMDGFSAGKPEPQSGKVPGGKPASRDGSAGSAGGADKKQAAGDELNDRSVDNLLG